VLRRHLSALSPLRALARREGLDPDDLLREVAEFRVALDAEMTVAAAAVDEGRPDIAAQALHGASGELGAWGGRLAQAPTPRRPVRGRLPIAVAAAVVGLVGGLTLGQLVHVGSAVTPAGQTLLARADAHFVALSAAASTGDPAEVERAATTLQASLSALVDAAQAGDRVAAQRAAQMLIDEQPLISAVPPHVAAKLLAEQRRLSKSLQSSLGTLLPAIASGHPSVPSVGVKGPSRGTRPSPSPVSVSIVPSAAPSAGAPSGGASSTAQPTTAPSSAPPSASASGSAGASASSSPSPSRNSSPSPFLPGAEGGPGLGS
jgi:hypothetical protein